MFGPMSVASSRGSPCRSAAARWVKRAVNSSATGSSTSSRVPARHTCPALSYWPTAWRDRQVEVGVREHQQRGLAAQFQRHRGQLRARGGGDQAAGRDRAGERDPGQVRVRRQRRAGLAAQALDDVEHAVRQTGVAGDVGQQAGGQRRPLRRLGHHRVPGRERGRDPPGRQHERGVPRRDHRGDPGGRPGHLLAVAGDLQAAAVQLGEPVGEEAEVLRDPRHHAAAVGAEQRAVVAGLHLRQVLDPPLDAVGDRVQDGGPVRRRGRAPSRGTPPRPPAPRRATSASPPRATSASGCSSMGERSVNVPGDATRRPPIQCRVSTATPATSALAHRHPVRPSVPIAATHSRQSAARAVRCPAAAVRAAASLARPAALAPSRGRPPGRFVWLQTL